MSYLLIADDDLDDCFLAEEAWRETRIPVESRFVHDGASLIRTLESQQNTPDLILLDLNMPIMDGRETLKALKTNEKTSNIPVVILSTTHQEEDIRKVYALGANSFIRKPNSYTDFVNIMETIADYWFNTVVLPVPQQ